MPPPGLMAPTRSGGTTSTEALVKAARPYRCPGCERMHTIHPCFPGCGTHWNRSDGGES